MNNLYYKVAAASFGLVLSFALGANKEAKAATFILTGTNFSVHGLSMGEDLYGRPINTGVYVRKLTNFDGSITDPEVRVFYEFDIGNLSLAPNTIISSAILNTPFINFTPWYGDFLYLDLFGYAGNGIPERSDFNAGVKLAEADTFKYYSSSYLGFFPSGEINFNVTNFVKQRVSNGDDFAGLGLRIGKPDFTSNNYGSIYLGGPEGQGHSRLIIETVAVPEPTTIFGSALALGVGGWLKRKKSNSQTKTTSQH
jgi:hypothetical protein